MLSVSTAVIVKVMKPRYRNVSNNGLDTQLAFADVTEMELLHGDPEYTDWIAQGRPELPSAGEEPSS